MGEDGAQELMRVLHGLPTEPLGNGTVVTIGKFDGVHAGHRAILEMLVDLARQRNLESVVISFDRHPLSLLAPEFCPPPVASIEERIERIADTGVDATLILPFTKHVAEQEPESFITQTLAKLLNCKAVLVGEDFHFGHMGRGDVQMLRTIGAEVGIEVIVIPDIVGQDDKRVSTSAIRAAIAEGDIATSISLLGTPPTASGVVVRGAQRGRELGFPTANLGAGRTREGNQVELVGVFPEDGVYAGYLSVSEGQGWTTYPAAISVGTNPTFGQLPRVVEAYAIDQHGLDLYGLKARVAFVGRLRGMESFENVEALIDQMHQDVDYAKVILSTRNV